MSTGSSIPYHLRPNKAVDRELFLALLTRLAAYLRLEEYQYIGLGGPFLEDFRLIHARLGIKDLISVESEEAVHQRQLFNQPVDCLTCVHKTLEDYLDEQDFDEPVIIWFDYTKPSEITAQIERFARTVGVVPAGSILRVTLNANPTSLGDPPASELAVEVGELSADRGTKPTKPEWRLERFKERLGRLFPSGLTSSGMTHKTFGKSVLWALSLAVEKEALSHSDRKMVWALSTHYSDGQAMATATLIVCDPDDTATEKIVDGWEFRSKPEDPLLLDMPALSTAERLAMEAAPDPKARLGFELPKSDMGKDPFESFERFYRIYPHFSRVEL